ncbi:hypothetical protein D9757_003971 [Collybiopsis confluens]|uniref:Uncharacterized protein n=1 Tax=Collybiopsis confluens TaxID=2823264 RepID=A0A8H5HWS9_9AGAR|nr:hypothetical protein D9757_003971 [Collybiopsis confluens]
MLFCSKLVLLTLLPLVLAAPAPAPGAEVEERATEATTFCGQWDTSASGNYELLLDQWGLSGASSGSSDCASITSSSGSTIAWTTTWKWIGGTGVKSFTNIQLNAGINRQLSAIGTIPNRFTKTDYRFKKSTWNWKQTSTGTIVADVAYDLFTSNSPGSTLPCFFSTGAATTEIMIWLANFNAGPISSSYNSAGQPNPVATGISLAGHTWNLYSGSNGANAVFSFLPSTAGTQITSFSGDVKTFLTTIDGSFYAQYLTQHEGLSTSQYLTTFQAGTEATSGSATLTT